MARSSLPQDRKNVERVREKDRIVNVMIAPACLLYGNVMRKIMVVDMIFLCFPFSFLFFFFFFSMRICARVIDILIWQVSYEGVGMVEKYMRHLHETYYDFTYLTSTAICIC